MRDPGHDLQSDTPEDLLDSTGQRLGGVGRLGGGETDQLSSGVGKGGGDEDGAEATEAVLEGARIIPESVAPVLVVLAARGATTADQDQGDDHKDDGSCELEARTPKLFLGVSQGTENVDEDDEKPEDGDPDGHVDVSVPVLAGEGDDGQLKREDDEPLEDLGYVSKRG